MSDFFRLVPLGATMDVCRSLPIMTSKLRSSPSNPLKPRDLITSPLELIKHGGLTIEKEKDEVPSRLNDVNIVTILRRYKRLLKLLWNHPAIHHRKILDPCQDPSHSPLDHIREHSPLKINAFSEPTKEESVRFSHWGISSKSAE